MELYQLNTFVRIAQEGSLTRAAELLFTSQPAISAQIKALEEELGLTLFERSARGMQLTAKGEALYQQAVATLDAAARLKADAQQLQHELVGELRIGVHTDFEFMRIGELQRRFGERHAQVRPHFLQGMTSTILPDVRRGALDGGFFFGPCPFSDLHVHPLAGVPMRLVAPAAWQARVESAELKALLDLPWVYTSATCPFYALTQRLVEADGGEPPTVACADSEDAVRALVRAGAGLSMLRADDAERMRDAGEVCIWDGAEPVLELGFAIRRQRAGEPMVDALLAVIREMWPDNAMAARRVGA
ncbi:MAG: LysR family transcriptional regulator [Gammaproteobacteria bacterium]|nr:LysR family transcriptional regulator [Gammaproteobacteria bacterium]